VLVECLVLPLSAFGGNRRRKFHCNGDLHSSYLFLSAKKQIMLNNACIAGLWVSTHDGPTLIPHNEALDAEVRSGIHSHHERSVQV
jgi:hypothetical protein